MFYNYHVENESNESEVTFPTRKELNFHDHIIELIEEEGAVQFSEDYLSRITSILESYWSIDPAIVKRYTEFRSRSAPKAQTYRTFPTNGVNYSTDSRDHYGIILTDRGMNLTLAHRISPTENSLEEGFIDNFSGTLAHEVAHGGSDASNLFPSDPSFNNQFLSDWQSQFGWHSFLVRNDTDGFPRNLPDPSEGWKKNDKNHWQRNDYEIMGVQYTTMPEKCIGGREGYAARVGFGEDVCDSTAAFLLKSPTLDVDKRQMITERIAFYAKRKKVT